MSGGGAAWGLRQQGEPVVGPGRAGRESGLGGRLWRMKGMGAMRGP